MTLIGNLATDVDLREVGDGKQLAGFLLAVDRPGKEEADFVWVCGVGPAGGGLHQFLAKGRRVAVDGRLRSSSWEEEGKRRTKVEVVANSVQFLSPAPERRGGTGGRRPVRGGRRVAATPS